MNASVSKMIPAFSLLRKLELLIEYPHARFDDVGMIEGPYFS